MQVSPTSSPDRGDEVFASTPSDIPKSVPSQRAAAKPEVSGGTKEGLPAPSANLPKGGVSQSRGVRGKSAAQASGKAGLTTTSSQDSASERPAMSVSQSMRDSPSFQGLGGIQQSDGESCASCSFTVPQSLSKQLPEGAPGSPNAQSGKKNGSPVLRTRGPLRRRHGASGESSSESSGDDGRGIASLSKAQTLASRAPLTSSTPKPIPPHAKRADAVKRSGTSSPTEALTYLTMRQPRSPEHYATLRHSIIRTLSVETLPRGSSSGPIVFTSPQSGHTIAFIFRLPDPHARGHRRTYALIALSSPISSQSTPKSSSAMLESLSLSDTDAAAPSGAAISTVTTAFARMASWITSLAELGASNRKRDAHGNGSATQAGAQEHTPGSPLATKQSGGGGDVRVTPASSFLAAKRIDPDGYPRGGAAAREMTTAKSLAEICGREGLFVELHVRFVKLLGGLMNVRV